MDVVIGVVATRDIVATLLDGRAIDLRAMMRAAPVIPDQLDAMDALGALRQAEVPMALVHDEYGHFEGVVTPADLLIAIAGEFVSDADTEEAPRSEENTSELQSLMSISYAVFCLKKKNKKLKHQSKMNYIV